MPQEVADKLLIVKVISKRRSGLGLRKFMRE
jgi:hypothetical protein